MDTERAEEICLGYCKPWDKGGNGGSVLGVAIKALLAEVERLRAERNEEDDEWRDMLYVLIDAIGGKRGESIPEDVEHAKAEVKRLQTEVRTLEHTVKKLDEARDALANPLEIRYHMPPWGS